jgi:hypothetical protein
VGKLVTVMIYVLKKIPEELRRLAVVGVMKVAPLVIENPAGPFGPVMKLAFP